MVDIKPTYLDSSIRFIPHHQLSISRRRHQHPQHHYRTVDIPSTPKFHCTAFYLHVPLPIPTPTIKQSGLDPKHCCSTRTSIEITK